MPDSPNAPLVYCAAPLARALKPILQTATQATGIAVRWEVSGNGSLFRRLFEQRNRPQADVIVTFGPYAAQAAALEGLLDETHPTTWERTPSSPARSHAESAQWRWLPIDYTPFRGIGAPAPTTFADLRADPVRVLALLDPGRSEGGLFALLGLLDRSRRLEGGAESVWGWWQHRIDRGVVLDDESEAVVEAVRSGRASHALLTGGATGALLRDLPPVPNAIGLVRGAPNSGAAKTLIEWLTGPEAAPSIASAGLLSPWQSETNGLQALTDAGPLLDVDWTFAQYGEARRRWRGLIGAT